MILSELLRGFIVLGTQGDLEQEVASIESSFTHSFEVKGPLPPGNRTLYVHFGALLPGEEKRLFQSQVRMLIIDRAVTAPPEVTVVRVVNAFEVYALLCARWAGDPSKGLAVTAVTGTTGKTSVTTIFDSILRTAGYKTALFGTLRYQLGDEVVSAKPDVKFTTPAPPELHAMLARAKKQGITHATLEASSQGLHEHRLDGIHLDTAVFTNFSGEHLDYHGTLDDYFAAKAALFLNVLSLSEKKHRRACINLSDPKGRALAKLLRASDVEVIGFGRRPGSGHDLYFRRATHDRQGIQAQIALPSGTLEIRSSLLGPINLMNILAAAAAAHASVISPEIIARGIEQCAIVPGRLHRLENPLGIMLYFDWAHTVSGFRSVLHLLKQWKGKSHRLLTVFGCEDAMDVEKRTATSQTAARYSDEIFVTLEHLNDDEREVIQTQMSEAIRSFDKPTHWFPRAEDAIRSALDRAQPGDTVAILGMNMEALDQAQEWLARYRQERAPS